MPLIDMPLASLYEYEGRNPRPRDMDEYWEAALEEMRGVDPAVELAPHARQAPAHCGTCGFFVPFTGGLGQGFGGCANEFSPDDGRVVAVDHGCGAHSEGSALAAEMGPAPALVDEFTFEVVIDDDAAPAPPDDPPTS